MARNSIPEQPDPEPGLPVHSTPPGASPRGLRSESFLTRESPPPPDVPGLEEFLEKMPSVPPADVNPAVLDWDFAMPTPGAPKKQDPHLDTDANSLRQIALRPPVETEAFPSPSRERFAGNWERLASEPLRHRKGKEPRKSERSPLTRWLFTNGRLDFGAALGPLLLIALLTGLAIYGTRLLLGSGQQHPPATESRHK